MKNLFYLIIVVLFVSCANKINDEGISQLSLYTSFEQFDGSGLNLYPFIPFSEKEWKEMSYAYKLEKRQIPEDFLRKMTARELFYQFVCCDLSKSMLLFNNLQQGIESSKQLNMLPELLKRSEAGHVLLEILKKADPVQIKDLDGHWWFDCLTLIAAQPELINCMSDEDIKDYISELIRCQNVIRNLSEIDENWIYPESTGTILFGFGNVMMRYEFDPFKQLLESNLSFQSLMRYAIVSDKQIVTLMNDLIADFKINKK